MIVHILNIDIITGGGYNLKCTAEKEAVLNGKIHSI